MTRAGGSHAGVESVQLPAAVERARRQGPFAGRADELEQLRAVWAGVRETGSVALVMLEGEPGAGKTRLAAELAAAVTDDGGVVLFGRCDPEVPAPFRPWLGVLGGLAELASDDLLSEHEAEHGAELARILGTLDGRLAAPAPAADTDPDAERHRLLTAAAGLVVTAARRRPILIVFDDLQFADRASLLLLLELLRGVESPVLAAATVRALDGDHGAPFREFSGELRREPAVTVLTVEGLDLASTRELVAEALPAGAIDDVARSVHEDTDGNALFVVELLRHFAELGGVPSGGTPPRTITELVGRRATQLGDGPARVLRFAAALGRSFDFDLLIHVLDAPADEVLDALERAVAAGLVAEVGNRSGRFQFSHGVVQHALAAEISDLRRRALHRRAAEWLAAVSERNVVRAGELALHWEAAGSDFIEQTVAACMEAGERALEMLALDDAVRAFQQAQRLLEQSAEEHEALRNVVLVRLGDAQRRAGHEGYGERLLEAAELAQHRGDPELLVRAALANSRGMHANFFATDQRRVAVLEAALDAVAPEAVGDRALLLGVLASELFADRERRWARADEALDAARRSGDDRVLAEVLYRRCLTVAEPSTVEERLRLTAELEQLGERLDEPIVRARAALERGRVLFEAGRADAIATAERAIELGPQVGSAFMRYLTAGYEAVLLQREGRYEEAEASGLRRAEHGTAVVPDAMNIFAALILPIRWDQGRLGELADWAAQVAGQPEADLGHRALVPLALVEAGRDDEARGALEAAAAEGIPVEQNVLYMVAAILWAEGCLRLGHVASAELALARLAPWRDQYAFTGVSLMGSVARPCAGLAALLGRHDDARRDYALAETVEGRIGAVGPLARCWLDHGRWLVAQDEEEAGRERIERARAAAEAHGLAGIATQAEAALTTNSSPNGRHSDNSATTSASWTREGDVWSLDFGGQVTRLRDAKGIHHVVRLLGSPGVEIAAAELAGPGSAEGAREAGDAGPALDAQAKAEYRARITELQEEIEEAEGFNDPERAARAREELDWIGRSLSQAVGLGGRDRPQASGAERARVNVTRAIHTTLKRIAEHDPRAGRMLSDAVRTGTFCVYEPDPSRPVAWTLPD